MNTFRIPLTLVLTLCGLLCVAGVFAFSPTAHACTQGDTSCGYWSYINPGTDMCGGDYTGDDSDGNPLYSPIILCPNQWQDAEFLNVSSVVCASNADLPHLPDTSPNPDLAGYAANYVATHASRCVLAPNEYFQWQYNGPPSNPGDLLWDAGFGWNTFGPSNGSGVATVALPEGTPVWVREMYHNDYSIFSPTGSDLNCDGDAANYNNYDAIYGPPIYTPRFQNYCVAWNVGPVGGACAAAQNTCTRGTVNDTADSSSYYNWDCQGFNGGGTVSCQEAIPLIAVAGSCSATHYNCAAGSYANDGSNNATNWTWSCNGANGGGNSGTCTENKAIAGSCSATHYNCAAGSYANDGSNNATNWTWSCNGSNGGGNSGTCTENKVVAGACAATHNNCSAGSYAGDASNNPTTWTWSCNGANGGGNSGTCTENKVIAGVCAATHYNCTTPASSINNDNSDPNAYHWVCPGSNGGASSPVCNETKPPAAPTVTLQPCGNTNCSITTAQQFRLTMTSSNATSCQWTRTGSYAGNWANQPVPAPSTSFDSGLQNWPTGNATWTFSCSNTAGAGPGAAATLTVSNSAPTTPALTCPASAIQNQASAPCTFTSTDPEGDQVKYQIDWGDGAGWSQWVPAAGLVASGVQQNAAHTWAATGNKTVQVRAQDSAGSTSGAANAPVQVNAPLPSCVITANPTTIAPGGNVTIGWNCSNSTSCTQLSMADGFSTAGGTCSAGTCSGSDVVNPTTSTSYGIHCVGPGGPKDAPSPPVTVVPPNAFISADPPLITQTPPDNKTYIKGICTSIPLGTAVLTGPSFANPYTSLASRTHILTAADNGSYTFTDATGKGIPTGALTTQSMYTITCTPASGTPVDNSLTVKFRPVFVPF